MWWSWREAAAHQLAVVDLACCSRVWRFHEDEIWQLLGFRVWYDKPEKYLDRYYRGITVYVETVETKGLFRRVKTLAELKSALSESGPDDDSVMEYQLITELDELPERVTYDQLKKLPLELREIN